MGAPFASGTARLIHLAASMAVVPVLLRALGREEFALWMAITSLYVATSFVDLGLGGSLVNRLSAAGATHSDSSRAVSSAVVGLSLFWGAVAILLLALAPVLHWNRIFGLPRGTRFQVGAPAMLMLLCLCVIGPLGLIGRIRLGLGRMHVQSLWDGIASVLSFVGMLLAATLGGGLTMVMLSFAVAPLTSMAANWTQLLRKYPWLTPGWRNASWANFASMFRQSRLFFLIALCSAVSYGCDSFIAISILGARAAAEPLIALRLVSALQTLMTGMVLPYWPRLSRLGAGSVTDRKRALSAAFALVLLMSVTAAGSIPLLGPTVVKLWTAGAAELLPNLVTPISIWIFVFGVAQGLVVVFSVDHLIKTQFAIVAISSVLILLCKIGGVMLWGAPGLVWGGTAALVGGTVVPLAALLTSDLRRRA